MGLSFLTLLSVVVAVVVLVRLYTVLGKHDGFEQPPSPRERWDRPKESKKEQDYGEDSGKVIPLPTRSSRNTTMDPATAPDPGPAPSGESIPGIADIQAVDRRFTADSFVDGAKIAFGMVIEAYAAGDRDTLRGLLNADVMRNFEIAIDQRDAAGESQETSLESIESAEILDAAMRGPLATVVVKFVSRQVNAIYDKQGALADGDPDLAMTITDIWTFERDTTDRSNPNWVLIATDSEN